jgi:spermidine synthase
MLHLHWGTSIYTFSMMLALILMGMVIGSSKAGERLDEETDPLRLLGQTQLWTAVISAAALYLYFPRFLPQAEAIGRIAPLPMLLVLGYFWGVAFPVAIRCYSGGGTQAGRTVGRLLAANTLGCIAGALVGGFILIPLLGSGVAGGLLAALSALMALLLFAVHPAGLGKSIRLPEWGTFAACVALLILAGDPYYRLIMARAETTLPNDAVVFSHHEEAAAATTAFGEPGSSRRKQLWVNGTGMTELDTVTKLMAHLPIWLADDPNEVLIICFGMGTTLRSASRHEQVNVTAVELVPHVIQCVGYYHADGPEVLRQPHVRAVVDDGRNYLLMHPDRLYDVITVDPAPPLFSAGAVNLYSRDFFQLCRNRLKPGGVMCLWIPPERKSEVMMIARTYIDVFEQVTAWAGTEHFPGLLLIGSRHPVARVPERIRAGFRSAVVRADLLEWDRDFDTPEKILDLYLADKQKLREFLGSAPVITDDHPLTEFPLWRAVLQKEEFGQELTQQRVRDYLKARRSSKNQ